MGDVDDENRHGKHLGKTVMSLCAEGPERRQVEILSNEPGIAITFCAAECQCCPIHRSGHLPIQPYLSGSICTDRYEQPSSSLRLPVPETNNIEPHQWDPQSHRTDYLTTSTTTTTLLYKLSFGRHLKADLAPKMVGFRWRRVTERRDEEEGRFAEKGDGGGGL